MDKKQRCYIYISSQAIYMCHLRIYICASSEDTEAPSDTAVTITIWVLPPEMSRSSRIMKVSVLGTVTDCWPM